MISAEADEPFCVPLLVAEGDCARRKQKGMARTDGWMHCIINCVFKLVLHMA